MGTLTNETRRRTVFLGRVIVNASPLIWVGNFIPADAVATTAPSLLSPPIHDRRELQAQLQIVIDGLKATIVFNPVFTALFLPAFALSASPFGPVPASNLWAAMGLQIFGAGMAFLIHRRYRRVEAEAVPQLEKILIAGQVLFSSVWGAILFLFWLPGNPVNQIFLIMIMSLASYAIVFARSVHIPMLLVALAIQGGSMLLRLAISDDALARAMIPVILMYVFYLWLMGRGSNRQIGAMIAARFSNEDLAAALREARDDALRKRYEAESANASKTAFLANMSHELRTPLNAILGFSEIIAQQSLGPDQMERYSDYARDIHESGAHLLSLINDMLDVAKIESGRMEIEPQWVDPRMVVEDVSRLMASRAAQKHQSLEIEVAPDAPLVLADERAFRQMLLNLLSNAVKFTQDGGHIVISCGGRPDGGLPDGGLEVSVRDNGPGIPEDKLARVMEPFSQIDNRFDREAGGTGLGLALTDGLARLHGGKLTLESGAGVTATLYFPSTKKIAPVTAAGGNRARA
jgi:two-component system, cell cycle sensor histidine kinase PleC